MKNRVVERSRRFRGMTPAMILTLAMVCALPALCQDTKTSQATDSEPKSGAGVGSELLSYLNIADGGNQRVFQPLTQSERNRLFAKYLINPVWYLKAAASAGMNQWSDKPSEWEQGASGYGKRFADIMGQYAITRTTMFGFESLLHEDNRYFVSGKKDFWPRMGYALSSGVLARHDNGKRYPSASLLIGFASGASLSRLWLPPSESSVGDAATSFGISMGWNIGLGMVKEYLPDILRSLKKGHKPATANQPSGTPAQPTDSKTPSGVTK